MSDNVSALAGRMSDHKERNMYSRACCTPRRASEARVKNIFIISLFVYQKSDKFLLAVLDF